jgi:hypothetical protein
MILGRRVGCICTRWGWGTHTKPSGETYEGEWVDDVMEGKARLTFADGAFFEGEFANNARVKGKYATADGATEYVGRWKHDLRDGYGTFHQSGHYKYMGEWQVRAPAERERAWSCGLTCGD